MSLLEASLSYTPAEGTPGLHAKQFSPALLATALSLLESAARRAPLAAPLRKFILDITARFTEAIPCENARTCETENSMTKAFLRASFPVVRPRSRTKASRLSPPKVCSHSLLCGAFCVIQSQKSQKI